MCDYSLEHMRSRQAVVGETLQLSRAASGSVGCLDGDTAVCLLPGTILSVTLPPTPLCHPNVLDALRDVGRTSRAEFIQEHSWLHSDGLRFSNGVKMSLQCLDGAMIEVLDPAVKDIEAEALKKSPTELVTETA